MPAFQVARLQRSSLCQSLRLPHTDMALVGPGDRGTWHTDIAVSAARVSSTCCACSPGKSWHHGQRATQGSAEQRRPLGAARVWHASAVACRIFTADRGNGRRAAGAREAEKACWAAERHPVTCSGKRRAAIIRRCPRPAYRTGWVRRRSCGGDRAARVVAGCCLVSELMSASCSCRRELRAPVRCFRRGRSRARHHHPRRIGGGRLSAA